MDWYPSKRAGLAWGVLLLAALLVTGCSLLSGLLRSPVDLAAFGRALLLLVTLALAVGVAYACYGLATLSYRVERDGIAVRWAAGRDLIPMGEIRDVTPFPEGKRLRGGIGWPGYRFGCAYLEEVGPVRVYCTGSPESGLLVRTDRVAYLISPVAAAGFLTSYRSCRRLGEFRRWTAGRQLPALLSLSIYRDRPAAALFALGLILNAGLFGRLAALYPSLPSRMILSVNPQGYGDRIGARSELFWLPAVGLAVALLNALLAAWTHRRDRVPALLLLGIVPLVEALAWLAMLRLVS